MAYVGPTPGALRYAIGAKIGDLEKELRYTILSNMQIFLDKMEFKKSAMSGCFGCIEMAFFCNTYPIKLVVELSMSDLPAYYLYNENDIDMYNIEVVKSVVDNWAKVHVPYVPIL